MLRHIQRIYHREHFHLQLLCQKIKNLNVHAMPEGSKAALKTTDTFHSPPIKSLF